MTFRAKTGFAVLALVLLLGVAYLVVDRVEAVQPVALPIERETTHITAPVGPDGRVDFAAALNGGPFPAPEANAAILLMRLVGTDELIGDLQEIRALLDAPADLPREGLFEAQPEEPPFFQDIEEVETEEEREAFRGWVERNGKALELILAASQRPQLALPFTRGSDLRLQSVLPHKTWMQSRDLLQVRAELRRVDGQVNEGWRDVQTQLRLARLLEQSPVIVSRLTATSMWRESFAWVGRALASGDLDEAACGDVRRVLLALPAPAGVGSRVLESERLILLDLYIRTVADGIRADNGDPARHPANVPLAAALREINVWFDRARAELGPTAAESLVLLRKTAAELRARVKSLREELDSVSGRAKHVTEDLVSGGAALGRVVGTVLASMVLSVLPWAVERCLGVQAHRQLVLVAVALRVHERRTGTFPATLADLDSDMLPDLSGGPLDLTAVTYERGKEGCSLACNCGFEDERVEIAAGSR